MKRFATITLAIFAALVLAGPSPALAGKRTDEATLRDVQPTNFAVGKKEHQQYDFSVLTAGRSYQCRTLQNKKVNATEFVVGAAINFVTDGKNGEVKTSQGKSAKCLITRVEDTPR